MKIVLLSGGSGTRLWPLSNDSRSKQFLKVLKDESGKTESMVQRVWRQLHESGLNSSTFITTSKSQVEMIQSQLNDCPPIIIEPERKDTFPAIALSTSYFLSETITDLSEIIVVLPVDLYVESNFFTTISLLEKTMQMENLDIALLGVKPSYPTEKYGYIVPKTSDNCVSDLMRVDHFIEKPTVEVADQLITQDALWNCGVFAFKLEYMKNIISDRRLPENYGELLEVYKNIKKISFDFEVLEKEKNLVVLPYHGKWKDLGTWDSLIGEMDSNQWGKGIISNCDQVNLVNELDIPIVVMGLNKVVVAASPDGILVSDIGVTPQLKDTIKSIDSRPMYEERRWGWFRVLDYTVNEELEEVLTKRICIKESHNLSYQMHLKRTETWNIISGVGEVIIDGKYNMIKSGDVIKISKEQKHSIRAIKDLEIIEIQKGFELIEEDVIRYKLSWKEIKEQVLEEGSFNSI